MRRFVCPITQKSMVWLNVNEYAVTDSSETLKTVLGSCVAIILWDADKGFVGINHYLNAQKAEGLSQKLIGEMKRRGCETISGMISGGSKQQASSFAIGDENIKFAKEFLKKNGIRSLKEEVGGEIGRTITVSLDGRDIVFESAKHRDSESEASTTKEKVASLRRKNAPEPTKQDSAKEMTNASSEAFEFLQELMKKSKASKSA